MASALVSPVFLVHPPEIALPGRPGACGCLLGNGEGPHISSVALLPFALAFAWLALERRRPAGLRPPLSARALVALTNFYGATALAIFYPVLVWSLWVTHRDNRIWLRAASIPALAYGLSAFWLTPSYLRITIENLQYVSSRGNGWSAVLSSPRRRLVCGGVAAGRSGRTGHAYPSSLPAACCFWD